MAKLIYAQAFQVFAATTVGEFILGQLCLNQLDDTTDPDADSVAALVDEIWNCDLNTALRAGSTTPRNHVPASDGTTSTLELFPDEWVYIPRLESQSPNWKLHSLPVGGGDVGAACTLIAQWANENGYPLPPKDGSANLVSGDQSIDGDTLQSYVLNSVLRTIGKTDTVYFYVASTDISVVDAPPSTDASGAVTAPAHATPPWTAPFWHYIDRLRGEAEKHSKQFDALHQLLVDAKLITAVLGVVDATMTVMERDLKPPPPPTGFIDRALSSIGAAYSPDQGLTLNIADVHAKVKALLPLAKQDLVDAPTFKAIDEFNASIAALAAIENEPGFQTVYAEFDKQRAKYPAAESAYQLACAAYVPARVLGPTSDAKMQEYLDAFLKENPGSSPITSEIAKVFSGQVIATVADGAALTALSTGNAPGPSSLWVQLTKLAFIKELWKLRKQDAGRGDALAILDSVADRLELASGVSKATLMNWKQLRGMAPGAEGWTPLAQSEAVLARINAVDGLANRTQSGPRFLGMLTVLNLWGMLAGITAAGQDQGLDRAVDVMGSVGSGLGVSADVSQFLLTKSLSVESGAASGFLMIIKADNAGKLVDVLEVTSKYLGWACAGAGIAYGCMELAQGHAFDPDKRDWLKLLQGGGNIAISVGWAFETFLSRRVALLAVEYSLVDAAAVGTAEAILLAAGSVITVVGTIIVIGTLAYTHKDQLEKIAYALFEPGTGKYVDAILAAIQKSKPISLGSAAVQQAVAAAIASSKTSMYVTWMMSDDVAKELRALGLDEGDIKLLKSIPVRVGTPMGV